MGCGCNKIKKCCGCTSSCSCKCKCTSSCTSQENCAEICTALIASNSWNVPACVASAVLSVPGLATVLIGSYIFNPTYGWFRITAFDSVNKQITVYNECLPANASPGTAVPSGTLFIFTGPPGATTINYSAYSAGSNYVFTGAHAAIVFGTTSPSIVITVPGTYLIMSRLGVYLNGLNTLGGNSINSTLRRTNNTLMDLTANQTIYTTSDSSAAPVTRTYMGTLDPIIYTTTNSNDVLSLFGSFTGVSAGGTIECPYASIVAVKLS